jgi:arylsulfatase A-like enzyme
VGSKRQPFEESIRVPFLIRWPGRIPSGRRSDALFGAIDITPTLCALAGVPVPKTCMGQDFSSALRGKNGPHPESQFIMHISKKNASRGDKHPAPLFRGVTTGRYTYAVYPDRPWCLYDNATDPLQVHNRIEDPACAEVRNHMRRLLADWLARAEDPFIIPD